MVRIEDADAPAADGEATDAWDGPSKSRRKRDMLALQALGAELAAPSVERLRLLELPEALREALLQVKGFKAHGAVRRQMQYIGRLMREVDPAPLRARLDAWNGVSREAVARQHLAEHWRARLLSDDDAFGELLTQFEAVDIPTLRTLIRNARKEQGEARPPRNFRELYRALLALIEAAA